MLHTFIAIEQDVFNTIYYTENPYLLFQVPWVIQSQTLADEHGAQEAGLVSSSSEADSFASHSHSHPNLLNQQAHRCQISLAGYFHSWVHTQIQASGKVHEQVPVIHTHHDSKITCAIELCPAKHVSSAPTVLGAAVLLQHHTAQAPMERMCSVLVWKLKTVPAGTHLVPAPWQNSSDFFLEDFRCSVPGWVELGANRSRWKCTLLRLGIGTRHALKVPSKPNYSVILWDFSDVWLIYSLHLWLEFRLSISAMPGSSMNILTPSSACLSHRLSIPGRLQW